MRRFLLSWMVVAILSSCGPKQESEASVSADRLEGVVEVPEVVEVNSIVQCAMNGAGEMLVLTTSPSELVCVDVAEKRHELIGRPGEGPGDLPSRLCFLSRDGEFAWVHGINSRRTSVYRGCAYESYSSCDIPIISCVRWGDRMAAELHVAADKRTAEVFGNGRMLGLFQRDSLEADWVAYRRAADAEYSSYPTVDYTRNLFWRLVPRDTDSFYRVPLWGSSRIEIWDSTLTMVTSFAIPTERARGIPADASELAAFGPADAMVVRDAQSDSRGLLHVVAPAESDGGGDLLIVFDTRGAVLSRYRLDRAVMCAAVSRDGREYLAVDARGNVVSFVRPAPE